MPWRPFRFLRGWSERHAELQQLGAAAGAARQRKGALATELETGRKRSERSERVGFEDPSPVREDVGTTEVKS